MLEGPDDAVADGPGSPIRGIVEGYYGEPWSWDERIAVSRYCAERGMSHLVYAPKDDPFHRARWRELYDRGEIAGFEQLIAEGGLAVGFGISPGLDIDPDDAEDRATLRRKVDQIVDLGASLVMLALDDIPFNPDGGAAHARLTSDLHEHLLGRASLVLIPTEYVGTRATPYLEALAAGVPAEVPIGWTGDAVVNDAITVDEARARAAVLGGRPPLIWDNYPVNDATMADRLFMGPLWGRDPGLVAECSGYLANPMVQPMASRLPLASIAGWLRGEDPLQAWVDDAGPLRVFAEACDGIVPQALVQELVAEIDGPEWAAAARPIAEWLVAAAACEAPGLEQEAGDWILQVHREARLGLAALRLVQAGRPIVHVDEDGVGKVTGPQPDAGMAEALIIGGRWAHVRRAEKTVMGVRCGFRPVLAQRASGDWRVDRRAIEEGQNAIDALVRASLDTLDHLPDEPGPVEILLDGEPVEVDAEGRFTVPPGSEVVSICGDVRTTQLTPCTAPVPPP